jgi:acetyltransferase-like isoleucine patch superfamily enzyme
MRIHSLPSLLAGMKRRTLRALAHALQPYLANAPVFWGDTARIHIGKNVDLADTILNARSGEIFIEDYVFFGHHCLVLTGRHEYRLKDEARMRTVRTAGYDIRIRRGAWIASNVVIIGPCDIGEHTVITAGSVIQGDVPAGVIYGGNPPKCISSIRFDN